MKQNKLNKHGQPFSKKQKKASRTMMANRKGFQARDKAGSQFQMGSDIGLMASIAGILLGKKIRRKAS